LLGYEGLEVINSEGGTVDAEVEAQRGRWKGEEDDEVPVLVAGETFKVAAEEGQKS
ncbi:hypothetical protein SSX86_033131, partial [Deinandra increscens subsp. villosa]